MGGGFALVVVLLVNVLLFFLMVARMSLFPPLDGVLVYFVFFLGGCVIKRVDG